MSVTTMGDDEGSLGKAAEKLTALVRKVVQDGVGPISGSAVYAEDRLQRARKDGRAEAEAAEVAIRSVIRECVAAAGVNGFVTGLGGLVALPVALPANAAGNLIVNARMVGAIAYLRGYSLNDPHTQTLVTLIVAGSSLQMAASSAGVEIGKQTAKQVIKSIPIAVLRKINARAGFFLVAKYGGKRALLTLGKAIPIVGGLVGGGVDATLTRAIASLAKKQLPAE